MIRFLWVCLSASLTYSARFSYYFDQECKNELVKSLAFTDVCTWSSNTISGSFSFFLSSCTDSNLEIKAFNLTDSPQCIGADPYTFFVNTSCSEYNGYYIRASDFTCKSLNTSYNILTHFTSDCQDGGYAFSVELGKETCQQSSFAPGLFDWDVSGAYSDPFYRMEIFDSKDGSCKNETVFFETKEFPALCIQPSHTFKSIAVDIYSSFPLLPPV